MWHLLLLALTFPFVASSVKTSEPWDYLQIGPRPNESTRFLYMDPTQAVKDAYNLCMFCDQKSLSDGHYRYRQEQQCISHYQIGNRIDNTLRTSKEINNKKLAFCNTGEPPGCGPPSSSAAHNWTCSYGYTSSLYTVYSNCYQKCDLTGEFHQVIYCNTSLIWETVYESRSPCKAQESTTLSPVVHKDKADSENNTTVYVIIAIVFGLIVVVCILVVAWCHHRRNRNKKRPENGDIEMVGYDRQALVPHNIDDVIEADEADPLRQDMVEIEVPEEKQKLVEPIENEGEKDREEIDVPNDIQYLVEPRDNDNDEDIDIENQLLQNHAVGGVDDDATAPKTETHASGLNEESHENTSEHSTLRKLQNDFVTERLVSKLAKGPLVSTDLSILNLSTHSDHDVDETKYRMNKPSNEVDNIEHNNDAIVRPKTIVSIDPSGVSLNIKEEMPLLKCTILKKLCTNGGDVFKPSSLQFSVYVVKGESIIMTPIHDAPNGIVLLEIIQKTTSRWRTTDNWTWTINNLTEDDAGMYDWKIVYSNQNYLKGNVELKFDSETNGRQVSRPNPIGHSVRDAISQRQTQNPMNPTPNQGSQTQNQGNQTQNQGNQTQNQGNQQQNQGNQPQNQCIQTQSYSNQIQNQFNQPQNQGIQTQNEGNQPQKQSNQTQNQENQTQPKNIQFQNQDNQPQKRSNQTQNQGTKTLNPVSNQKYTQQTNVVIPQQHPQTAPGQPVRSDNIQSFPSLDPQLADKSSASSDYIPLNLSSFSSDDSVEHTRCRYKARTKPQQPQLQSEPPDLNVSSLDSHKSYDSVDGANRNMCVQPVVQTQLSSPAFPPISERMEPLGSETLEPSVEVETSDCENENEHYTEPKHVYQQHSEGHTDDTGDEHCTEMKGVYQHSDEHDTDETGDSDEKDDENDL